MNQSQFTSFLKTLIGFAAGFISAKGWVSADTATAIAGALMAFVPLAWGWFSHTDLANIQTAAATPEVSTIAIKPTATDGIAAAASDPTQPKIVHQ